MAPALSLTRLQPNPLTPTSSRAGADGIGGADGGIDVNRLMELADLAEEEEEEERALQPGPAHRD